MKRKQRFEEDRIKQEAKRPKLTLLLDSTATKSLSNIANKLLNIHERIKKFGTFISNPVDVVLNDNFCDSGGGESGSANTSADEGTSGADKDTREPKDREKGKSERKGTSSRESSKNSFPMEFLDKRRSSRVKNILNKTSDIDERNVSESILELLPDSIKNPKNTVIEETPSENEHFLQAKNYSVTDSEIAKLFTSRIEKMKSRRKTIKYMDLLEEFLYVIGFHKGFIMPAAFIDLYAIFREFFRLPCAPLCIIGKDIELENVWLTLTANEIQFNKLEALFLTQLSVHLEQVLPSEKYVEFLVRLLTLRGIKENDIELLEYTLNFLEDTSLQILASNKNVINRSVVKSLIESKSVEDMSNMIQEQNFNDLIDLLKNKPENEITFVEEKVLSEAIINSQQWDKGVEIYGNRNELKNLALETIKQCLETGNKSKLTYNLTMKLIKLAAEGHSVAPWVCLYWGLLAEGVTDSKVLNKFFKLGHQYLGKRGHCTGNNGEFLILAVQHFVNEEIDDETIKCFSCLYDYPPRRSTGGNVHKSPHVKLRWENCELIFHWIIPEDLPEFDSIFRLTGIQPECEPLLNRIVDTVPKHLDPSSKIDRILEYVEKGSALPEILENATNAVTETLYYFLADFYFKNREFA